MPYYITDKSTDCNGWAVVIADGTVFGCHKTKQAAIDQALAISLSEDEPFMGELDKREQRATYTPPQGVRNAAKRALEWIADGKAGSGFTAVGRRRASQLANGEPVSDVTVARMRSYFARHEVDKQATGFSSGEEGFPTPGRVAWDAWGGDAGQSWVNGLDENRNTDEGIKDVHQQPDNMDSVQTERHSMSKWFNASHAIIAKLEGGTPEQRSLGGRENRTYHFSDLEVRDGEQGMTFSGYAALFNTDSLPLPFIERIAPGAFKRSLSSRNEIKLLWNHDSGEPLASLRGGSLKLTEDERGLKVDAVLANTTRGRDTAELIRTGVIDSMSFGFNVIKDSWSNDGSVRTLESVRLFEASIVAFPAYESTAGTVSVRSIDADKLAESLEKLEAGDELSTDQAELLKDVVTRLSAKPEPETVTEPEGDLLALAKAKILLLEKLA